MILSFSLMTPFMMPSGVPVVIDVPPQLRAVGSAGGDRRGGGGTERAEAQAEEHKRVVGPVHVQKAWSAEMKVSARASPGVAGVCLYSLGRLPCVL